MPTSFEDRVSFQNRVTFTGGSGTVTLPSGVVSSSNINGTLGADYLVHQEAVTFRIRGTVSSQTEIVYIAKTTGLIRYVSTVMGTKPSGSDTYTVDVQKYSGGSWATVLTGVVSWSTADTNNTPKYGTLTTPTGVSIAAGELVRVVGTLTGTVGADLCVTIEMQMNAT